MSSELVERYLELEKRRAKAAHEGDEDVILDEMDALWLEMSTEERETINNISTMWMLEG